MVSETKERAYEQEEEEEEIPVKASKMLGKGPFCTFVVYDAPLTKKGNVAPEDVLRRYIIWRRLPVETRRALSELYASQFPAYRNYDFHPDLVCKYDRDKDCVARGKPLKATEFLSWIEYRLCRDPSLADGKSSYDLAFELAEEWNRMSKNEKLEFANKMKVKDADKEIFRYSKKEGELPLRYYSTFWRKNSQIKQRTKNIKVKDHLMKFTKKESKSIQSKGPVQDSETEINHWSPR